VRFRSGQFKQILPKKPFRLGFDDTTANGDVCGEQGWYGEETLDVEAVHAMAPGANVLYVGGASCEDSDLLAAITTILDGHLAQIITNSWGDLGEPDPVYGTDILAIYGQTFLQAAIEGIGVFFSSGDNGTTASIPRTARPPSTSRRRTRSSPRSAGRRWRSTRTTATSSRRAGRRAPAACPPTAPHGTRPSRATSSTAAGAA
jgi:hypothetical protein